MTYGRLEDTFRHSPKVARLARTLGVRRAEARGLLTGLWSAILLHAPDGDLSEFEPNEIEELADWEGEPGALLAALQDPRHTFLETSRRGVRNGSAPRLYVHDWDQHAEGLKRREWKRAERQRKTRVSRDSSDEDERQTPDSRARGSDLDLDPIRIRSGSGDEQEQEQERDAPRSAPAEDRGPTAPAEPLELIPPEAAETPVLVFPATGRQRTWDLTPAFLALLVQRYPHVDVRAELALALSKAKTGALRSVPTAKGYPRFVWSWLDRAAGQAPRSTTPPARAAPRGSQPGDPGNIDAIGTWLGREEAR